MSRVGGFSSEYLAEDIEYLHRISSLQTIHGDFTLEMAIRGNNTLLVSLEGDCYIEIALLDFGFFSLQNS